MSDDTNLETADSQVREPSGANTAGLATRFVDTVQASEAATATTGEDGVPRVDGLTPKDRDVPPEPEPEPASDTAADGRRRPLLLWVGLFASTVGLCALLFVVYVNSFSSLQQHRDQRILLNEFTAANRANILTGHGAHEGDPAGVVSARAIGLSQVFVYGTSATDLLKGPGLMPGTARPGSLGNSVIAGHRTIAGSPFAHLASLRTGDRIIVVSPTGSYRYRVIAVGSARTGERDPTSPNRHPRLTLVTSNPSGNGRLYVVASLMTTPNQLPIPRHPPSSSQRGLSGDAAAIVPSILWGLLVAMGFAATLWAYRRYRGRQWSVYLLSTPVLLALTFVWYGNLIRLLPGTT